MHPQPTGPVPPPVPLLRLDPEGLARLDGWCRVGQEQWFVSQVYGGVRMANNGLWYAYPRGFRNGWNDPYPLEGFDTRAEAMKSAKATHEQMTRSAEKVK